MTQKLQDLIVQAQKNGLESAVMIQSEKTHDQFYYGSQRIFRAASVIKLGIALYLNEPIKRHPELLTQRVTLSSDELVGGAGVISHLQQKTWTIADLVDLMLSVSDNAAANYFLKRFSLEVISDWLQSNFKEVMLGRFFMQKGKHENMISAPGLMAIWQKIMSLDGVYGDLVRKGLKHQANRSKLVAAVPASLETFNKTGELENEQHDCARLINPETGCSVDVCVLTHFDDSERVCEALQLNQEIGRLMASHLLRTE